MPTPTLEKLFEELSVSIVIAILGGIATWLAAVWKRDRAKFHGRWRATIRWTPEWGKKLLGKPVSNPYSMGEICLAYGAGGGQTEYWGLSVWQLMDGDKCYSELCVEMMEIRVGRSLISSEFPWFKVSRLVQMALASRIRKRRVDFPYLNFAQYTVEFSESTGNHLKAGVWVNERNQKLKVGSFTADRIS